MQAMALRSIGGALEWTELPDREPGPGMIRVKVAACGVCRTDLHVVDGELPDLACGPRYAGAAAPGGSAGLGSFRG